MEFQARAVKQKRRFQGNDFGFDYKCLREEKKNCRSAVETGSGSLFESVH
jgi:hypothetical protein